MMMYCIHNSISLLGEAPIWKNAATRKRRETPIGLTGTAGLRFCLMQLDDT